MAPDRRNGYGNSQTKTIVGLSINNQIILNYCVNIKATFYLTHCSRKRRSKNRLFLNYTTNCSAGAGVTYYPKQFNQCKPGAERLPTDTKTVKTMRLWTRLLKAGRVWIESMIATLNRGRYAAPFTDPRYVVQPENEKTVLTTDSSELIYQSSTSLVTLINSVNGNGYQQWVVSHLFSICFRGKLPFCHC